MLLSSCDHPRVNMYVCQSLVACVEMLREQKADRDEVLDGLRDKV